VGHASQWVPGATCLSQALALHRLLVCAGFPSIIKIGVRKDAQTGFEAHAWVEHDGRPLLNHPSVVQRYEQLLGLDGAPSTAVTATTMA
jgi:hypothetical protein